MKRYAEWVIVLPMISYNFYSLSLFVVSVLWGIAFYFYSKKNQNRKKISSEDIDLFHSQEWNNFERTIKSYGGGVQEKFFLLKNEYLKLNSLLNTISDPIVALDENGFVLFFNKNLNLLFGETEIGQEFLNKLDLSIQNELDFVKINKIPKKIRDIKIDINGKPNDFRIKLSPILVNEKYKGVICLFANVTYEEEILRMRDSFISNVSHELRSPITSIQGYAQLIQAKENLPSDVVQKLETILVNTKRMTRLIDDLTRLAQIETEDKLKDELINLPSFFEQIISDKKARYIDKKFFLVTDFSLPAIKGDKELLKLAFANVVSNSFKYSSDSLNLTIKSYIEKGKAIVEFRDDGIGFDPADQERVLHRFFRSQNALNSQMKGTGIGLAIVKHIVLKHGGDIVVTTELGKGCIVKILFPIWRGKNE